MLALHRTHHRLAIRNAVRHRLLAVNVLPRRNRVHGNLLMPVVGHRHDDSFNVLVVENLLVPSRGADLRTRNLLRQRVPPVIKIARRNTLGLRQRYRYPQQRRSLDTNADRCESNALTRRWRCRSLLGCQGKVTPGNHGS